MAKPAQLLTIEPANELKFQGPFRTAVASYMRLTNPTDHDIYFKIKTTAPKKYCVRPNCGLLEPRESQEIAIVLQPFIFDSNEKNKHKFMVQSMVKPDDEDINLEDLWKKYPEKLMDSKLRCVFECPLDSNQPAQATDGSNAAAAAAPNSKQPNAAAGNEGNAQFSNAQFNAMSNDDELQSEAALLKEIKKLRDNESVLRQENLQLREQIVQLHMEAEGRAKEQSSPAGATAAAKSVPVQSVPVHYQNPYSPPPPQLGRIPSLDSWYALAFAIFICFVGVLIGKSMVSESSK
ncbi:AGAP000626-PA [Anopheles gambiae str. PEST]|uniref:AGAP000626-PA n=2 Tax=gambiae species complex TaxID=44542 RepID=Q7QFR1_ANOGA|nr:vesicle-associated membrane protein-associated protein B-like isoform X1 [Anopheles coluzzii]XP_310452.5 vesicle-associated membrane protein-associated protein B isoform X1 [Anopheles gambiae]EAA06671.5 AGAP000626-PA [Anopheles gambiae str. PEST]